MKGTEIADGYVLPALDLNRHALKGFLFRNGEVQATVNPSRQPSACGNESVHLFNGPFLKVIFVESIGPSRLRCFEGLRQW